MSFEFDDFVNWGSGDAERETRLGVENAVMTALGSRPFARGKGTSWAGMENESPDDTVLQVIKAQIAESLAFYSLSLPANRRIIVSQELIQFLVDEKADLHVQVQVYLLSDLNNASANPVDLVVRLS